MSWLANRVQTARLRGKNGMLRAAEILQRLGIRAGENNPSRFLSSAINVKRERGAPVQSKNKQGGQI